MVRCRGRRHDGELDEEAGGRWSSWRRAVGAGVSVESGTVDLRRDIGGGGGGREGLCAGNRDDGEEERSGVK